MMHLPSRHLAVFATAFGLAVLAAPAAHAFTFDDQSNTTPSGGARYTDPDAKFDSSSKNRTTIQQGNTTFQFGSPQGGSFDERYNPNRMFDTLGGPGRDGYR